MNIQKAIKNRQKTSIKMTELGFSCFDIGRYFEIPPSTVRDILKEAKITPNEKSIRSSNELLLLLNHRNKLYDEALINGEIDDFNERFGFVELRKNSTLSNTIEVNDLPFAPETIDSDYISIFNGEKTPEDIADEKNVKLYKYKKEFKERMISLGCKDTTFNKIAERGKLFKGHQKDFFSYLEFYADGWTNKETEQYTKIPTSTIGMYRTFIGKSDIDIDTHISRETIEDMFRAGCKSKDILNFCHLRQGSPDHQNKTKDTPLDLTTIRKEMGIKGSNPYFHEKRREELGKILFNEYKSGKTQQEIADEYGLNRTQALQHIKEYKQAHPDEALEERVTTLSRRRNIDAVRRAKKQKETELVLASYERNKDIPRPKELVGTPPISLISKETGVQYQKVQQILEENGLYYNKFYKVLQEVKEMRHKEMKEATIGMSTSEIMQDRFGGNKSYVGDFSRDGLNKRNKVLSDQRVTRNFLNNNPLAKQKVIEKQGKLTRSEMLKDIAEALEHEDIEPEL